MQATLVSTVRRYYYDARAQAPVYYRSVRRVWRRLRRRLLRVLATLKWHAKLAADVMIEEPDACVSQPAGAPLSIAGLVSLEEQLTAIKAHMESLSTSTSVSMSTTLHESSALPISVPVSMSVSPTLPVQSMAPPPPPPPPPPPMMMMTVKPASEPVRLPTVTTGGGCSVSIQSSSMQSSSNHVAKEVKREDSMPSLADMIREAHSKGKPLLRKTEVVRSPGGTPFRNPAIVGDDQNQHAAGVRNSMDSVSEAMVKRFRNVPLKHKELDEEDVLKSVNH